MKAQFTRRRIGQRENRRTENSPLRRIISKVVGVDRLCMLITFTLKIFLPNVVPFRMSSLSRKYIQVIKNIRLSIAISICFISLTPFIWSIISGREFVLLKLANIDFR